MELIRLQNVTKKYDGKSVLSNISQVFQKDTSIAFLGANGCGKSTLLKLIAGLISPDSSQVSYASPLLFHYVPEKFPSTPLTAREYLSRMGAIGGMDCIRAKHRVETLAEDFFLDGLLDTRMPVLSKGSLQKVGVIQAFLQKPDVLLLDEPLSGQDAKSQSVFLEKVNYLQKEGVTLFMACHEPRLVDAIAEISYVLVDGELTIYKPKITAIYSLLLENPGHLQPDDKMSKSGRYYKLQLKEEDCDKQLAPLLMQGWKLRFMERIEKE
ncbi:MAG: ABC transporter ATP-binding protein [Blautia sp.]|nr:ABC transporter ATP-binding protein [Lachnoclostridium sp.]MCM1211064.1 ABC transporter ATP-binding protein [Blautia sp.]